MPLHKVVSIGGIMLSEGSAHCRHSPWMCPVPWTTRCYWNYSDKGVEVAWLWNWFLYRVTFGAQASEAGWLFVGHWAVWRPGTTCILSTWMFVWPTAQKRTMHIHVTSPWEFHSSMRRKNWVSTQNTKPQELSRDTSSQFHLWSQEVQRRPPCSGNSLAPNTAAL